MISRKDKVYRDIASLTPKHIKVSKYLRSGWGTLRHFFIIAVPPKSKNPLAFFATEALCYLYCNGMVPA